MQSHWLHLSRSSTSLSLHMVRCSVRFKVAVQVKRPKRTNYSWVVVYNGGVSTALWLMWSQNLYKCLRLMIRGAESQCLLFSIGHSSSWVYLNVAQSRVLIKSSNSFTATTLTCRPLINKLGSVTSCTELVTESTANCLQKEGFEKDGVLIE